MNYTMFDIFETSYIISQANGFLNHLVSPLIFPMFFFTKYATLIDRLAQNKKQSW